MRVSSVSISNQFLVMGILCVRVVCLLRQGEVKKLASKEIQLSEKIKKWFRDLGVPNQPNY